ncbi:MAG: bifunctional riboflavin kinase/FAD synthetase, partial [Actinomycetota bacterium]|nr:bifunctional riboflavin kinase/FAD synthetase [Actinomycetota bacterium]
TMIALGRELGFDVEVVEDHAHDDGTRRWSSSWVRELLAVGDVRGASYVLGRPHRLRGTVVRGDQRGRELGFPTANLGPDLSGMVPADGVYAGYVRVLDLPGADAASASPLPAAVSIGTNPTFDGVERRVEAYVLDRTDLELYGREVVVELVGRLRDTLRFESVAELVAQMHADVAAVAGELAES